MADEHQYCTFYLDGHYFGLDVLNVQEIIRYQEMTRVPLAPPVVRGLINLRGQIVIAVDARRSLGLPVETKPAAACNIIVRSEGGSISLLVDDIGDVLDVPLESFAPVPENMPAERKELIDGVYNLRERLLLVLATERLLQRACG